MREQPGGALSATAGGVEARWALVGKLPGDKGDHRVLRSSGGRSTLGDFAELVRTAIPGTPQLGGAGQGAGALPWVTFVPGVDTGGRHWIAVTIMKPTADRDVAGRPNVETYYVSVPFSAVAERGASYQALHAAVAAAGIPCDGHQLSLALPAAAADTAAALADAAVFDRAARLAALLVAGEVVITLHDAQPLRCDTRLVTFDQVAALLPFGLRAGIAIATWHDGTQPGLFRLAFGPFAARGQAVAADAADIPPPPPGPARDYLVALSSLRDQVSMTELLGYLADHRAPRAFGDGAEARDILRDLAEPGLVVAAARGGRVGAERVVATRRHASGRLDQGSLDALEAYLMARGGDKAAEAEVRAGWSGRSPRTAARLVLSQVAAAGTSRSARRLHELVTQQGDAELFLAALAAGMSLDGSPVPARNVAGLLCGLVTPTRGELPRLRRAVLRQPVTARWLLRRSLRGKAGQPGWQQWLEWLDPAGEAVPSWLIPYAGLTAAGPGAPSRLPGVPPAWHDWIPAGTDTEDVALVARLASLTGPLGPLVGAWWPLLLRLVHGRSGMPLAERAEADFAALTGRVDDPPPDMLTAARLDTIRLYLARTPRYFPMAGAAPACLRYLDTLWGLWSEPPLAEDVTILADRLLGAVLPSAAGPAQPHAAARGALGESAITLLLAVVRDDRIPLGETIGDRIADVCAAVPALLDDPRLTDDWWARVNALRPALREPPARLRAAARRPGADPVEIAVLWGRAAASGDSAEELLSIIDPWLATRTPEEISAMRHVMEGVMRLSGKARP